MLKKQKNRKKLKVKMKNPKSKLSFLKGIIPYFGSQWSFAQLKIMDTKTKIIFPPDE